MYLFLNRTIAAMYIDWDLYLSRYKNKFSRFSHPPNLTLTYSIPPARWAQIISVASTKVRDSEDYRQAMAPKVRDGRCRMNATDDVGSIRCGEISMHGSNPSIRVSLQFETLNHITPLFFIEALAVNYSRLSYMCLTMLHKKFQNVICCIK